MTTTRSAAGASGAFPSSARFVHRRHLGSGAFGAVFEALDQERGGLVAIKSLHAGDAEALYRFKHEFRSLAGLVHPNLVQLYELFADEGEWYFTMELVDGVDARTYANGVSVPDDASSAITRSGSPVDEARIRALLGQLATGLQYLHDAGKWHRDIKPSNILVAKDGRVVLLDFGLVSDAAVFGAASVGGAVVGTPQYMSPEQAAAEATTASSDWYSVGVLLYEMLVKRRPFVGDILRVLTDKIERDPVDPRQIDSRVPADLAALCMRLLSRDPAARPDGPEVLRVLGKRDKRDKRDERDERASTAMRAPTSIVVRAPLVGREPHARALEDAFARAADGETIAVLVHGQSGMGKSAVVRRLLANGGPKLADAVVLSGRCYEEESVPYKAVDGVVDSLSRYLQSLPESDARALLPRDLSTLVRLFPVLLQVPAIQNTPRREGEVPNAHELRRRGFGALRELLARLGNERTVVVFIDDLQWGDVDSAALLADLLRPPDPPRMLLVATYRSDEADRSACLRALLPALLEMKSAVATIDVPVLPLDAREACDLARGLLATAAGVTTANAEAIGLASAGCPFLVEELVRFASERGAMQPQRGEEALLDEVIRARVAALPEPARALVEVLAVAGRPLDRLVATRAANLGEAELATIAQVRSAGLVRSRASGGLEVFHDRIREALTSALSTARKRVHHLHIAHEILALAQRDPESLAYHFLGAGEEVRAAQYAREAAEKASAALGFDRAAGFYAMALDLEPAAKGARELRIRMGEALVNAGRGADAADAFLAAAPEADPREALELRRRAAEQLLITGHVRRGLEVVHLVLAAVGLRLARTTFGALLSLLVRRAWVRVRGLGFVERKESALSADEILRVDVCWTVAIGLSLIDVVRGADFQARHLLLALKAGEPYRIARALALEAGFSASDGGGSRRRTQMLLDATHALAQRIGHPHALGLATVISGMTAQLEGRWRASREFGVAAAKLLRERCTGVTWELDTAESSLFALPYLGEIKELSELLPAMVREAQARGDLFGELNLRSNEHLVLLAADQPETAKTRVDEIEKRWGQDAFYLQNYFTTLCAGEVALYRGDGAAAWSLMLARWPSLTRSLLLTVQFIRIEATNLRARAALCAAASDGVGAPKLLAIAETSAKRLRKEDMPWASALSQLVLAGVASARGERDRAMGLLSAASANFMAADMMLHARVAERRRGELRGADDGRVERDTADAWMRAQGIANPDGFVRMVAPGRWVASPGAGP